MNDFKERVKQWLKDNGKNRYWLAEQCLVAKGTVDDWMKKGNSIPSVKANLIEKLMTQQPEERQSNVSVNLSADITISLSKEQYDNYIISANNMNMTLSEWIDYALQIAGENPDNILKHLGKK